MCVERSNAAISSWNKRLNSKWLSVNSSKAKSQLDHSVSKNLLKNQSIKQRKQLKQRMKRNPNNNRRKKKTKKLTGTMITVNNKSNKKATNSSGIVSFSSFSENLWSTWCGLVSSSMATICTSSHIRKNLKKEPSTIDYSRLHTTQDTSIKT